MQAIRSTRPGGSVGYVGVPHGVEFDGQELFFTTSTFTVVRRRCAATCLS